MATYRKVRYDEIYPGIDLLFYGNGRELEYDFIVAPRVDPSSIEIEFDGAARIDASGDLLINAGNEEIRQHKPYAYQVVDDRTIEVHGQYVQRRGNAFGFALADYDA